MRRDVRLLDEEGSYSVLSDRAVIPPFGVLGGGSGKPYVVAVLRNGIETGFPTPGKVTGHAIPPRRHGDHAFRKAAAGYGDPLTRAPVSVRRDVDEGLVSRARAADVYGVILDEGRGGRRRGERSRPNGACRRPLTGPGSSPTTPSTVRRCQGTAPDSGGCHPRWRHGSGSWKTV